MLLLEKWPLTDTLHSLSHPERTRSRPRLYHDEFNPVYAEAYEELETILYTGEFSQLPDFRF
jgi:hypothetical protein